MKKPTSNPAQIPIPKPRISNKLLRSAIAVQSLAMQWRRKYSDAKDIIMGKKRSKLCTQKMDN